VHFTTEVNSEVRIKVKGSEIEDKKIGRLED